MASRKPNFSVRLPPELLDALRGIAKDEKISVGSLIREALNGLVLSRLLGVR